jgi:hypothetical protein
VDEFKRRLKLAVARYGSEREAARAAKLPYPNMVSEFLLQPTRDMLLKTLAKFADGFGWPLERAIYWALGRPEPAGARSPHDLINDGMRQLGISKSDQGLVWTWIDRVTPKPPEEGPRTAGT